MDRRLTPVLATAAVALCACSTLPPAAPWPPEDAPSLVRVHDPGTAIGADAGVAAVGSPVAWDPASCLAVRVRVLWLARLPDHLLRPLTTRTRLLVSEGPSPLVATPAASRGARVQLFCSAEELEAALAKLEADLGPQPREGGEVTDPVRPAGIAPLDELAAALPPGITVAVEAHGGGGALTAVRIHRPRLVASLLPPWDPLARTLPGGDRPLDVGVVVRVARPTLPAVGTGASPAPAREETTGERLLLERLPWTDRLHLLALLPSPTVPDGGTDAARPGLAFAVEVGPPPAPDAPGWSAHRLAVAECAGDVARATTIRASLAAEPRTPEEGPDATPGLAVPPLLERLEARAERRRALLELALLTGADLTSDVAASGGELLLGDVAAEVRSATSAPAAPTLGPGLGWLVERVTIAALADATADPERAPEVGALLARRVGGLSLRPSALLAAVATSADQAAWQAALVTENRVLLEDGDAAVRARAHDWLDARGLAPGAYDPFAPLAARREALDRADADEAARRAEQLRGPSLQEVE